MLPKLKNKKASKARIIAIIPARGGSKGIPRKNIKLLAGKPMIAYIIEAVKKAKGIDRVLVSTEDVEIAEVAKKYGAEVPFLRPSELAEDGVATLPVLQHMISELQRREGYTPDYVLLVYPTSPLLTTERIEQAVNLALESKADSVVSGVLDKGHYWINDGLVHKRFYPLQVANRQMSSPLFKENGAIYLTRTNILEKQVVADELTPLIMEAEENIDVDEMSDFLKVEELIKQS